MKDLRKPSISKLRKTRVRKQLDCWYPLAQNPTDRMVGGIERKGSRLLSATQPPPSHLGEWINANFRVYDLRKTVENHHNQKEW